MILTKIWLFTWSKGRQYICLITYRSLPIHCRTYYFPLKSSISWNSGQFSFQRLTFSFLAYQIINKLWIISLLGIQIICYPLTLTVNMKNIIIFFNLWFLWTILSNIISKLFNQNRLSIFSIVDQIKLNLIC